VRTQAEPPRRTFGFLMQQRGRSLYQMLGNELKAATLASTAVRGEAVVEHRDDLSPEATADDGRGRWMDNVFIERVWRSLKHEDVYLRGYADGRAAKAGIGEYFAFYNERRLHQALGYRAPMAVWREGAAPRAYGHGDNAHALTTCPQADQNQQQTELFAA